MWSEPGLAVAGARLLSRMFDPEAKLLPLTVLKESSGGIFFFAFPMRLHWGVSGERTLTFPRQEFLRYTAKPRFESSMCCPEVRSRGCHRFLLEEKPLQLSRRAALTKA